MLLSVQDLSVRFRTEDGTVHAVNGIGFDLDSAETIGVVGESGCGKSATSLAITRLLPKSHAEIAGGRVLFEGTDLAKLPERDMRALRGRDIASVFQDPMTSLNPVLTIGRQLTEALTAHRPMRRPDSRARAVELLRMVGIPDPAATLQRYPHQLSGGMRQRVMIAMALALKPKLLIADEPTTALDVTIQAQVLELIRRLTQQNATAVILITHDLGVVAAMTQRVAVMYAGYIVEAAPTKALFAAPHHPYTVGLLQSLPRLDRKGRGDLVPIEGAPPDQLRPAAGCPFAPRCTRRVEACARLNPALTGAGSRQVACHNPVAEAGPA